MQMHFLYWDGRMHAGGFGSAEAGRDAAQTGASECIVGILIRLVVYVKTIVIPLYLVCCFVGNKLQSAKIWALNASPRFL